MLYQNIINLSYFRTDIAERLHDVMETQWQKALEILTSPSTDRTTAAGKKSSSKPIDAKNLDRERADGVAKLYVEEANSNKVENEIFETPTTSKTRKQISRSEESTDRLHAYIEFVSKIDKF